MITGDSKGSELASSSGYTEPVQSGTLSSEERAIFDDLFRALDVVVLERSIEGYAFRPIHNTVPDWAQKLIGKATDEFAQGLWVVQSDSLKDYVVRAAPWWDQHEGGASESILWEEEGPAESDLDLAATATAIGQQKLLVIKRCAPIRRAYIQLMREKKLNL